MLFKGILASLVMASALTGLPSRLLATSCDAPPKNWGPFQQLHRVEERLHRHLPITIVTMGSSSTYGTGATSPDRTYPAQLQAILQERFPASSINLINVGIGGETIASNLARFYRDVVFRRPDLVIWQVGTNDALQRRDDLEVRLGIISGIAQVRAIDADLVLMDAQYLPERPETPPMTRTRAVVQEVARNAKVVFLSRHALMSYWIESGRFTPGTMLISDRLHMTDASYRCLAERVADLLPPNKARPETEMRIAATDEHGKAGAASGIAK